MNAKLVLIAVFLCFMRPLAAQFADDFEDGNLDGWAGDVAHFIVNAEKELQLNAPTATTMAWIHTPVVFSDSMTWEFDFRLDFAPSTTNQLRIRLAMNSTDIATADGYYLEIGATGDQDALILNFANNGAPSPVAQSIDGLVAMEPVEMRLRVIKRENGDWEIYKLGGVPELLFTAFHNVIPLSQMNVFGFETEYTETRRDKFFFDNINIEEPQPDVTAPSFTSIEVVDENTVTLTFDEVIENSSANTPSNYMLTPGNLQPSSINANGNEITLDFGSDFVSLQPYTLTISGLKDEAGNVMTSAQAAFTFTEVGHALANELLITEIMADPTPVISLPDVEYLELFNYSAKVLSLADYTITVGSSKRQLPNELLQPMEYIILASEEDVSLLQSYGRVVKVDLPALTNSGAYINVADQQNNILHELTFDDQWYGDPDKSDGGWSLEMKNPENVCAGQSNWSASLHLSGGTPGQENSQWTIEPDVTGPDYVSFFLSSNQTIDIRFSERLDLTLMSDLGNYFVQPVNSVDAVSLVDPCTIQFHFLVPLDEFIAFSIPPFVAYDCLGNEKVTPAAITFGVVKDAQPGDLLINEVLFNPATGGSRFVEVYNMSNRFINLNNLVIAKLTLTDQDFYTVGLNEVISPYTLVVFTPDRADILSRYTVPDPNKLFTAALPSWDDEVDNVSLLVNGEVIDSFTYSADWHHPAIADQNGVSLERVSLSTPTTVASNWHSASSLSGYATPTGPNSQVLSPGVPGDKPYIVSTRNFSPNDDGYKDFLALEFNGNSTDALTSVWVYDREGREVIQLVSNETVGTQALVTWDGRTTDESLATMGIYVLLIRMWDLAGDVREFQESFALIER